MSCTVFANSNGLFHKGSGGKGVAPADVCLSPPPPPTGPAPVPYVNSLSASDLADGSTSVKIQGEPTALEDQSSISTSTGDEGGTQGGNVITHKTKGKGYFKTWSFDVKIEGKGVCRHSDMMGQNCTSDPPGCVDASAIVTFKTFSWYDLSKPCPKPYPGNDGTNEDQQKKVRKGPCWQCLKEGRPGLDSGYGDSEYFTPDHQPPQSAAWEAGGCHNEQEFNKWAASEEAVKPHCKKHSKSQGGTMRHQTTAMIRGWMA